MWRLSAFLRRCITTSSSRHRKKDGLFIIHPDVKEALADQRPVVALESTIITHGMPYPHNLSTAKEVEAIVRAEGAIPATIGILEGSIHVGLSSDELDFLAQSKMALKVSRRDLPYVISKGMSGGTTVSGTMIAAHKAGIPVFVTGGIGGVHRDGENCMFIKKNSYIHLKMFTCLYLMTNILSLVALDVSADLTELGRTPIAVVSAGVKSILDIGRTLEFLETQGVCVATYGESNSFPAFFSRQSEFTSPYHVSSPQEAADLIASTLSLGLQSGLLLAIPIPEEHAATGQQIEDAIQTAVKEASSQGVTGRDVTPFILQRVNELTKGKSLQANIALIKNNAKVGSQIACALSKHKEKTGGNFRGDIKTRKSKDQRTDSYAFGQTNPGSVCQSFGGVGRNIADCLSRLGQRPLFISAIGKDSHSEAVLNYCKHMDTSAVARLQDQRTATYCAVITESGELSLGLGDMDIHQQIQEQYVSQFEDQFASASLVVLDGNIPVSTIDYVCRIAKKRAVPVWFEPTDADKACKPFLSESWKALSYISPNLAELCTMNHTLGLPTPTEFPRSLEDVLGCVPALSRPLLEHLNCVVVTLGALGVMVCGEHAAGTVNLQPQKQKLKGRLCAVHYPALTVSSKETVNVSGAGDSFAGAMMVGILQGLDTDSCVRMGLLAARTSLLSPHPIDPSLTADDIHPEKLHSQLWPKPSFVWIED
ncbi:uncharacterized protein zgc:136858 isoform X2 [Carassius gibelio]|uniref:uncharacterized protein zgc:136858 isoform X2 n=1 Tax=Carassius gibelio TaxID=101364 RepID=UPI00227772CB|nr:uncharacterized protein zgc:136858 isoform X2 [Carassius gibelio]